MYVRDRLLRYLREIEPGTRVAIYRFGEQMGVIHEFTDDLESLRARIAGNSLQTRAIQDVDLAQVQAESDAQIARATSAGARESLQQMAEVQQRVEVLRDLSLQIEQGEFVATMGPSGSGKSTLLNLIGGLDRPDRGQVRVGGEDIAKLSPSRLAKWRSRHVGFVFQFYNLLPVLTAERNVEVPLLLTKLTAAQRQRSVQAALALVSLEDRAKHKPSELSGGQQQRVAIARAIVSDPTLLVCDEPTGDLDRESSESVLQLLKLLNEQQGKTIVMVTHDPRAASYATRRLFVDKGELIDSPSEVAA
jgi:putative ABC transport system ATP-binding protein